MCSSPNTQILLFLEGATYTWMCVCVEGGCLSLLLTAHLSPHYNKNHTDESIIAGAYPGIRGMVTHKTSQRSMIKPANHAEFLFFLSWLVFWVTHYSVTTELKYSHCETLAVFSSLWTISCFSQKLLPSVSAWKHSMMDMKAIPWSGQLCKHETNTNQNTAIDTRTNLKCLYNIEIEKKKKRRRLLRLLWLNPY